MKNEERVMKLLDDLCDDFGNSDHDIPLILAYADEIRMECDDSVQFVLTKVGINTDAGIRKVIRAAIMGKERRMTLESARCTKCGSNNFILMCVKCNDIGKHDDRIRRECNKDAFEAGYVAGFNSQHFEQDYMNEAFVEWEALMGKEAEVERIVSSTQAVMPTKTVVARIKDTP